MHSLTCTPWWLGSVHPCRGHLARNEFLSAFAADALDSMGWFRRTTRTCRQTSWNCVPRLPSTRKEQTKRQYEFNIKIRRSRAHLVFITGILAVSIHYYYTGTAPGTVLVTLTETLPALLLITCQNFQFWQVCSSDGLFVRLFVCPHGPCGHDTSRTVWPIITKLDTNMDPWSGQKPIVFLGQRSNN